MNGLDKLKAGDFNNMSQQWQPDSSVIVTLSSRKYPEVYRFRVRNLYKAGEQELDIDTGKPIAK